MNGRRLPAGALLVVLMMALLEFGQVWYYPAGFDGLEVTRAHGGAFRLLLWCAASVTIAAHLFRRGPEALVRALWPFVPFLAWGAVVLVFWSVDRVAGMRVLVFWGLACGLAAVVGHELPPGLLARSVAAVFGSVAAASLLLAVLDPAASHTVYGDRLIVRGFFPHKNQLGWYCAIGLIWCAGLRRECGGLLVAVVPALVVGLVTAESTTSSLIALFGVGFVLALQGVVRVFRDGGRAACAMLLGTAAVAAAVIVLAPALVAQLGRDTTMTGRTDVWQHYLSFIEERSPTGYGTGVFSTETEVNQAIGGSVPGLERENLHSPHNVYIGLVGETGIVGVVLFVLAQGFLAFGQPFRALSPWLRVSGALAFAILFAGLAEMRDAYAPGVATVALVAARAAGLRGGLPRKDLGKTAHIRAVARWRV